MRRIPRIKSVMTPFPYSVAPAATLADAREIMRQLDIHHLPVCEKHDLVGVLSESDIRVALAVEGGEALSVLDVCSREPFVVDLDASLDAVASQMAELRVAAAIVMRRDKLAGILTTTDVCRLLAECLRGGDSDRDDDVA